MQAPPPQDKLAYALSVLKHSILPTGAIVVSAFFYTIYSWRTFFLIYSSEDYVDMAKAKGLSSVAIERRYILRPDDADDRHQLCLDHHQPVDGVDRLGAHLQLAGSGTAHLPGHRLVLTLRSSSAPSSFTLICWLSPSLSSTSPTPSSILGSKWGTGGALS